MGLLFDVSPNFSTLKAHRFPSQKLQFLNFHTHPVLRPVMKGSSIEGKAVCKKSKQPRSSRSRRWFQWHSESWDFPEIWGKFHLTSCVCLSVPESCSNLWRSGFLDVWRCVGCWNASLDLLWWSMWKLPGRKESRVFALTSKIHRCWSFTWNQSREVSLRIHRKELAVFSAWSADPLGCAFDSAKNLCLLLTQS